MKTTFYALRYTDYTCRGKNYWVKISVNERQSIYRLEFLREGCVNPCKETNNYSRTLYLDPQEYKEFHERRIKSKD